MGAASAKATHYMTLPVGIPGLVLSNFTFRVLKNDAVEESIAVEVAEISSGLYIATFKNDGTDYSTWTVVAQADARTNVFYVETWEVRKKTIEQNIKQIRARQDSDGGFFKSPNS